MFPELRFGIPILWTLLWFIFGDEEVRTSLEVRGNLIVVFVEVFLAAVWVSTVGFGTVVVRLIQSQCAVSGYLSFFSMDCLMMRWYDSAIIFVIRLHH